MDSMEVWGISGSSMNNYAELVEDDDELISDHSDPRSTPPAGFCFR